MSGALEGKVALISGGGRGLGRSAALEMAREGANLVIVDLHRGEDGQAAADEVVREIRALGAHGAAALEDVTSYEAMQRAVALAVESFGRLDIVCTYAGNFVRDAITDLTPESFISSINVHLIGTFNCVHAAIPTMLAQKSGRIVTVSSRAAFSSGVPAYTAAKTGITGFTSALAHEMARKNTGITANCLLPSAYTQLFPTESVHPPLLQGMPRPKPEELDPADVAPLVAYLASDGAFHINGRFFFAGGGEIFLYAPPFALDDTNNLLRKQGRWTLSELDGLLGPLTQ